MRALTGSDVLVEDKLFATLDTTVRALQPEARAARPRLRHGRLHQEAAARPRRELPLDARRGARRATCWCTSSTRPIPRSRAQIEVTREVLARDRRRREPAPARAEQGRPPRRRGARAARSRALPTRCCSPRRDPTTSRRCAQRILAFFERDLDEEELVVPYALAARGRRGARARPRARGDARRARARACACAPPRRCSRACAPCSEERAGTFIEKLRKWGNGRVREPPGTSSFSTSQ